jgi:hypothetical protein
VTLEESCRRGRGWAGPAVHGQRRSADDGAGVRREAALERPTVEGVRGCGRGECGVDVAAVHDAAASSPAAEPDVDVAGRGRGWQRRDALLVAVFCESGEEVAVAVGRRGGEAALEQQDGRGGAADAAEAR